jgi:hypothetical protein
MSNPISSNGIANPQLIASRGGPQQPLYRPQGVPPTAAGNDNYLLQYQQHLQASQLNAVYANMANGGGAIHNPAMMGMAPGIVQSSPMATGGPALNMTAVAGMGQIIGNGPDGNMMPQSNHGAAGVYFFVQQLLFLRGLLI